MVIHVLHNSAYTSWGEPYSKFEWDDNWKIFLRLSEKERLNVDFHSPQKKYVNNIITFFDNGILQRMRKDTLTTLDVRIRAICGMVAKIPYMVLSRDLKVMFMLCIWDAYKKFYSRYMEWHCRYELELPF